MMKFSIVTEIFKFIFTLSNKNKDIPVFLYHFYYNTVNIDFD